MAWKDRLVVLLIMLAAVVAMAAGEVLLSKGMKETAGESPGWVAQVLRVARNPWIWGGVALLVVHLGLYMTALGKADLSLVLPLTALSYPLTSLLAQIFLGERVGLVRWLGTALITAGVAVIGLGGSWKGR